MRWDDLHPTAQRHFLELLDRPGLWAFAVVAAKLGMEEAIKACGVEGLPRAGADALREGGWDTLHLPSEEAVRSLMLAIHIRHRMRQKKKKDVNLKGVMDELGRPLSDGHAALRVLENYGGPKMTRGVV